MPQSTMINQIESYSLCGEDVARMTDNQAYLSALPYHQSGCLRQAEEICRLILQRTPDHADALGMLGAIACQCGDGTGVELLKRAITLAPEVARYYNNLGAAYLIQGRSEEAVAAFHRAHALKPELSAVTLNLEAMASDASTFSPYLVIESGPVNPNKRLAGMKMAILVSGQCRTLDLCITNLKVQVLRHFPNADLWVSIADGADSSQAHLLENVGLNVRLLEIVKQPTLDEKDYKEKPGNGMYCIGTGPEDRTIVQAILRQAWHLRRVFEMAAGSGEPYDAYMRLRPDQWFLTGVSGLPIVRPETAVVPWWGGFGGINDRFAILGPTAADAYCYWPRLDALLESGCSFHPETLTLHALQNSGADIVHTPARTATLKRDAAGALVIRYPENLPEEIIDMPSEYRRRAAKFLCDSRR